MYLFLFQMFLVTGGWDGAEILDSTEMYDPSVGSWANGAKLPQPMSGLKATNINDRVLIFGRYLHLYIYMIHKIVP